jgi:hypothetical protein
MMGNRSCFHGRSFSQLVVALSLVALGWGCGGDFSPTAPSIQPPSGSTPFAGQSASVISGQLLSGGGAVSAAALDAAPAVSPASVANLQVTVQGTNISTSTGPDGSFQLINVPNGDVTLQIVGGGVNASVMVTGVGASQNLKVTIQLQATSAQVVNTEVEELAEFEGLLASVDTIAGSFTLQDGTTIFVATTTWWDTGGDILSLGALALAALNGQTVELEGRTVTTTEGLLLGNVVKAVIVDVEPLELELKPDKWDVGWVGSGSPGTGGSGVEARITESPYQYILPSSVEMEGPDGIVFPVATELDDDRFEARFKKADAISIVASAAVGDLVTITVRGTLTGGTPWELTATIEVVDDDEDDDDGNGGGNDIDPALAAQAIADVEEVIAFINGLVASGDLAANVAKPLITKLEAAIASLEKLNGNPAIGQLGAFLNQLAAQEKTGKISAANAEILVEMVEDIIDLLEGAD